MVGCRETDVRRARSGEAGLKRTICRDVHANNFALRHAWRALAWRAGIIDLRGVEAEDAGSAGAFDADCVGIGDELCSRARGSATSDANTESKRFTRGPAMVSSEGAALAERTRRTYFVFTHVSFKLRIGTYFSGGLSRALGTGITVNQGRDGTGHRQFAFILFRKVPCARSPSETHQRFCRLRNRPLHTPLFARDSYNQFELGRSV